MKLQAPVLLPLLAASQATPPNVIVILVDDLGAADVSFNARHYNNGTSAFTTPNIDRIATDENAGVHLTNFFTQSSCGPSRASLMTGRLAHSIGNPFPMPTGGSLDSKYGTIAQEFKSRGYVNSFIGKWGIDSPKPFVDPSVSQAGYQIFNGREAGYGPIERGFDDFYGLIGSGHNHYTKEVVNPGVVDWHKHNKTHQLDYPDLDHEPETYSTHIFTREALNAIKGWKGTTSPGFLHLSYTAPHDPLQAPQEYLDLPECARIKNWRRRTFCGMVKVVDEGVGEIFQVLGDLNMLDNTIIYFSTDNGGAPSVGGFNYPFKGQKATPMNGGVLNPAAFYIPQTVAKVNPGEYDNLFHIADVGVTLLSFVDRVSGNRALGKFEMLGGDIDGVDHSAALLSSSSPVPRDSVVVEYSVLINQLAYIKGDYKLILGSSGRSDRFQEPETKWYDAQGRSRYVVEELVCDFFDRALGDNYFIYGWVWRFYVDAFYNAVLRGNRDGADTLSYINTIEVGDTIKVNQSKLPRPQWDKYQFDYVQLYNLKTDKFEDVNIALENRDLVEEMAQQARGLVRNDPGHHLSVQKQFAIFAISLFKWVALALLAALGLVVIAVYKVWRVIKTQKSLSKCYTALKRKHQTSKRKMQ